ELEYVKLEKDSEGMHFGLFREDKLLSIISLFINEDRAQFRKFATLIEEQGKGYGTKLLRFLLEEVAKYPLSCIFCNARIERTAYYEKFGLKRTEEYFEKGGRKYVIMEKKLSTQ
ncbi:MAG: GNAT family N-acetyltransferase, partial [Bacteroidota bacterium]